MEWLIIIGLVVIGYIYFKAKRKKPDFSMLPAQFIVLDLETTGLDPIKHEIIEIGAVKVNRDSNNHSTFQALVKPNKKVPKKITEITRITQEMLESEGEEISSVLKELVDFIGDLRIVTFNAEFDMGFLNEAAKRHEIEFQNPVSCALKMARRAWPGLKSYKLAHLANAGGLSSKGNHRALKDCELAITVYTAAASKLGSVQ